MEGRPRAFGGGGAKGKPKRGPTYREPAGWAGHRSGSAERAIGAGQPKPRPKGAGHLGVMKRQAAMSMVMTVATDPSRALSSLFSSSWGEGDKTRVRFCSSERSSSSQTPGGRRGGVRKRERKRAPARSESKAFLERKAWHGGVHGSGTRRHMGGASMETWATWQGPVGTRT